MSKLKMGLLTAGVLAFLAWAGCAPVSPPDEESAPEKKPDAPAQPAAEPVVPSGPVKDLLRSRIESAIDNVERRDLLLTNGFWTIFHGILGLGPRTTLLDAESGQRVNALEYIQNGGELRGLKFIPTRHGLDVQMGPQFVGQGHQDQFVAEMAQWGVPAEARFVVEGRNYTMMDFARHSQMRARVTQNQELGWAIVVIGQYLGTDVAWINESGERLEFADLLRYEMRAPMSEAACGGTHRLFGLSWALHLHLGRGGKAEGVWKEVEVFTDRYKQLARQFQNPDGSFSTNSFAGRGNDPNRERRINTTGHILEWLALALTDAELRQPWVQSAASALSLMILEMRTQPIDGGSLYHAVHGLKMYHARLYTPEKVGTAEMPIPLPHRAPPLPGSAAEETLRLPRPMPRR